MTNLSPLFDLPMTPPAPTPAPKPAFQPPAQPVPVRLPTTYPLRSASLYRIQGHILGTGDHGNVICEPERKRIYDPAEADGIRESLIRMYSLLTRATNHVHKNFNEDPKPAPTNPAETTTARDLLNAQKYGNPIYRVTSTDATPVNVSVHIGRQCPNCRQTGCLTVYLHASGTAIINGNGDAQLTVPVASMYQIGSWECLHCKAHGKHLPVQIIIN